MFSWDTPAEDVYKTLQEYENFELEVEEDEKYGKTITETAKNDEETFIYVFYFDNDTEKLWEIEAVAVLYDGEQVIPAFQALYEAYGLEKADAYENENLQAYAADFDSALEVQHLKMVYYEKVGFSSVCFVCCGICLCC